MKLQIALPIYNGADFMREAMDSILAQTLGDFELLVSDNCSTDETPSILADYARRDSRVRVSRSDVLLPQADNVNRAVSLCEGPWIQLFCHDDVMHPECLAEMHAVATERHASKLGLIGCGVEWLFANGHHHTLDEPRDEVSVSGIALARSIATGRGGASLPALSNAMVRKRAWESADRFDPRFLHFDIFCWMRLLIRWDYVYVPRPLVVTRIHGAQVAVSARTSLRSVDDQRGFWGQYLADFENELALDWKERARVRMKPFGSAGTYLAIELMKNRPRVALEMASKLPRAWWPILPIFAARSYVRETRRIHDVAQHVPLEMLYPG